MCIDAHYLDIYNDQLSFALEQGLEGDAAEDAARERAEPLYRKWVESGRSVIGLMPLVDVRRPMKSAGV